MFIESYIQQSDHLFTAYTGQTPLHLFLKSFFSRNKNLGSRDRKFIADLLYGIFRLGNGNAHLSIRQKIGIGALLSNSMPPLFFQKCFPEYEPFLKSPFQEKLKMLQLKMDFRMHVSFKWSDGMSEAAFIENLFQKPRVFIRIRKNKNHLLQALEQRQIPFIQENESCFSFDAGIKLQEILPSDHYVIQDMASQHAGHFFGPSKGQRWWDCCVGSGGKTIQLLDKENSVELVVSDIRESILHQFKIRMLQYHPDKNYEEHILDLTRNPSDILKFKKFDQIICDVPCSGSGTWRRSPEQFYFCTADRLQEYTICQGKILNNVLEYLKPGATLYYITCSVFSDENEQVVQNLPSGYEVERRLLNSFQQGGDALFMAKITRLT